MREMIAILLWNSMIPALVDGFEIDLRTVSDIVMLQLSE
jgi:hypothetical protein